MLLSILIVNYNTERYIASLLQQLTKQSLAASQFEVIVVNNVQNNTLELQTQAFDQLLHIRRVQAEYNMGFGRANNLAATHAQGKYILLMNPDIVLLQDGFLAELIVHAERGLSGIATTKQLNDSNEDRSCFYDYEFGKNFGFSGQICWLSGALMMLPLAVFRQLGGFDSDYFMYCEDVDLCLRAKQQGLPLQHWDDLAVKHIQGVSEPTRLFDFHVRWYRSQWLFAYKHYGDAFYNLLHKKERQAKYKVFLYGLTRLFKIDRFVFKLQQWQAMLYVIKSIRDKTPQALVFNGEAITRSDV